MSLSPLLFKFCLHVNSRCHLHVMCYKKKNQARRSFILYYWFFLFRIFWKGGTCAMLSKSCNKSSSHPSRPTARPVRRCPPPRPEARRLKSQKPERRKSRSPSSPTARPPVMESPRPRRFQTETLLDSSPESWVKVRAGLFGRFTSFILQGV